MAKINLVGDAVVVTSTMKYSDLETIEQYKPEALVLREDNKPVFKIALGAPFGTIDEFGASFGGQTHDENGFATITSCIRIKPCSDPKEFIADMLGTAMLKLNKLEATLPSVLYDINAEKAAIMDNIVIQ